jgi:hypothetical protein
MVTNLLPSGNTTSVVTTEVVTIGLFRFTDSLTGLKLIGLETPMALLLDPEVGVPDV